MANYLNLLASDLQRVNTEKYIILCGEAKTPTTSSGIASKYDAVANAAPPYLDMMDSACSLVMQDTADDHIVVSYILNSGSDEKTIINSIITDHQNSLNSDIALFESCQPDDEDYFEICVESDNLYIYKNTQYNFYLVTDTNIDIINPSWIDKVISFFSNLINVISQKNINEVTPFDLASYTSNFEKVYLLQNDDKSLSAYGVSELKYDETNQKVMGYIYLKYDDALDGSPDTSPPDLDNKINIDYINSLIENSKGEIVDNVLTPNPDDSTNLQTQEITVKYASSLDIWQYLTAMLRDRDLADTD